MGNFLIPLMRHVYWRTDSKLSFCFSVFFPQSLSGLGTVHPCNLAGVSDFKESRFSRLAILARAGSDSIPNPSRDRYATGEREPVSMSGDGEKVE
jgi:hypothetical protein